MKTNSIKQLLRLLIVLNICIFAFIGCKNEYPEKSVVSEQPQNFIEIEQPQSIIESIEEDETEQAVFDSAHYFQGENYSIAPSLFTDIDLPRPDDNMRWEKRVSIKYPQVYSGEDENFEKETRINKHIFKYILGLHNILDEKSGYISYDADYKITCSDDKVFSVLCTGIVSTPWKENWFCKALTLNFKTEELLQASDYISMHELSQKYISGEYRLIKSEFIGLSNEYFSYAIDSYFQDYSSDNYNNFYLYENGIGIIVPIFGDRCEYIILEFDL